METKENRDLSSQQVAIRIEGLQWQYDQNPDFMLSVPTLHVRKGECVGVVGANGSGKTTLINSINGLIPRLHRGAYSGSVDVFGQALSTMPMAQLCSFVGSVFSDPECQFTSMTVEEEIVFGLENLGLDYSTIESRVAAFAAKFRLGDLLKKSVFEISGGQKQRVALASVLAMTPRLLLLDEPTSMLDPVTRREMFEHLREIRADRDVTVVIAEHNLEYLAPIVDRFLLLEDGKIAMDAPPREFFAHLIAGNRETEIAIPDITLFCDWLRRRGLDVDLAIEISEGIRVIQDVLNRRTGLS